METKQFEIANKIKIFISYSYKDKKWLERIEPFLKAPDLRKKAIIWHDGYIQPGEELERKILMEIKEAQIALLLISVDFLDAESIIGTQLPAIIKSSEEGLTVVWIYLRACSYEESLIEQFTQLNSIPLSESETYVDKALKEITKKIKQVVDQKISGPSEPEVLDYRRKWLVPFLLLAVFIGIGFWMKYNCPSVNSATFTESEHDSVIRATLLPFPQPSVDTPPMLKYYYKNPNNNITTNTPPPKEKTNPSLLKCQIGPEQIDYYFWESLDSVKMSSFKTSPGNIDAFLKKFKEVSTRSRISIDGDKLKFNFPAKAKGLYFGFVLVQSCGSYISKSQGENYKSTKYGDIFIFWEAITQDSIELKINVSNAESK